MLAILTVYIVPYRPNVRRSVIIVCIGITGITGVIGVIGILNIRLTVSLFQYGFTILVWFRYSSTVSPFQYGFTILVWFHHSSTVSPCGIFTIRFMRYLYDPVCAVSLRSGLCGICSIFTTWAVWYMRYFYDFVVFGYCSLYYYNILIKDSEKKLNVSFCLAQILKQYISFLYAFLLLS